MVLLLGGPGCTGKTLMAQRLLERYQIPYLSIDHLKMGLIRGTENCRFTAESPDEEISRELWPILKAIVSTATENFQHMILEGCYLPQQQVRALTENNPQVLAAYLCFSPEYICEHWKDRIIANRSVIEQRLYPEEREAREFLTEHQQTRSLCLQYGLPCFTAEQNYQELDQLFDWLDDQILQLKQKDPRWVPQLCRKD